MADRMSSPIINHHGQTLIESEAQNIAAAVQHWATTTFGSVGADRAVAPFDCLAFARTRNGYISSTAKAAPPISPVSTKAIASWL
jgi:hypothetical protein